jgi:hypothetical protein
MIQEALGLFAAIAFITFLLAGICVGLRWRWETKAALIVLTAGVMVWCYSSLVGLLGWPSPFRADGEGLVLIHALVAEPEKAPASKGAIYLWVKSSEWGSAPRALQFPYSRDLHQTVVAALRSKQGGTSQGVKLSASNRGYERNETFSVFDIYKPRPTDKDRL